jgi:hypothetical protein
MKIIFMIVAVAAPQVAPGADRLHKDLKFSVIFTHCTLRLSNQQADIELKATVFSSGEIIQAVERIRQCDLPSIVIRIMVIHYFILHYPV